MQTEKQRRLASNASSAPRNTRCTTALNSCLSSASSASCPTSPVDLTNTSPKCARRQQKAEWPRPAPKRECPTCGCFVMRRDSATIPSLRRSKKRRASVGITAQENSLTQEGNPTDNHDPRNIPLSIGLGIQAAKQAF